MGKLQDQIAAAKGQVKPDGSRVFSDDVLYDKVISTENGKAALQAVGGDPAKLRAYLGLEVPAEVPDRTMTHPEVAQDPNPITRYVKLGAGALLEGAGAATGVPGSLVQLVDDHTPKDWPTHWDRKFPLAPNLSLPTGGEINEFTKGLGLTDRPDAEPQNLAERMGKGAAVGIGASVPFALATGGASTILTPEFMAAGALSGVGEEAANELSPGNPWLGLLGSVVGSIGGQMLTKKVLETMSNAAVRDTYESLKAKLDDLDLNAVHVANSHDAQLKTALDQAGQTLDQTKSVAQAATQAAQAAPRANIARHATTLSPVTGNWQDAGEAMQAAGKKWVENDLPDQLEQVWKPVSDMVPPDASLKLDNFGSALGRIVPDGGAMQGLIETVAPRLPQVLKQRLAGIVDAQMAGQAGEFTWQQARSFRTALGDALRNPKTRADLGDRNLRQLYAALTADLKDTATAAGAGDLFDAANKTSADLFDTAENVVGPILDSKAAPGDIAKRVAGKAAIDSNQIERLRKVIPDGVDALAAAHLSPDNFPGWTALRKNTRSAEALVPDPAMRGDIDTSIDAIAQAQGHGKTLEDLAGETHNMTVQAAKELRQRLKDQNKISKVELKQQVRDAKEALDERTARAGKGSLTKPLATIASLGSGGALGMGLDLALRGAGINLEGILGGGPGLALGLAVPAAIHGVNELIRHPDLAAGPLIGLTTHNALQRDRRSPEE